MKNIHVAASAGAGGSLAGVAATSISVGLLAALWSATTLKTAGVALPLIIGGAILTFGAGTIATATITIVGSLAITIPIAVVLALAALGAYAVYLTIARCL